MYRNPQTLTIAQRQEIEIAIIRQIFKDAVANGYSLGIFDGEEEFQPTTNKKLFEENIFNTDKDYIYIFKDNKQIGWIRLVYGNDGWDVISDYSTNLEETLLTNTLALTEKYGKKLGYL